MITSGSPEVSSAVSIPGRNTIDTKLMRKKRVMKQILTQQNELVLTSL
jgi:hypothetical protein